MVPIRALIVDDHPLSREATRQAILSLHQTAVVNTATTLKEALQKFSDDDIITLDLSLPDHSGAIELSSTILAFGGAPVLVISGSANPGVERQVMVSGGAGFLSKTVPLSEIPRAVEAVLAGKTWFSEQADAEDGEPVRGYDELAKLTEAERRVLQAMRDGKMNKQVSHELGLSEITVKTHVKAILKKLGVANRTQAILMARELES